MYTANAYCRCRVLQNMVRHILPKYSMYIEFAIQHKIFTSSITFLLCGNLVLASLNWGLDQKLLRSNSEIPSRKVGKLPALGWNTWNAYRCGLCLRSPYSFNSDCISDISAELVLDAARDFISLKLKDAGYQYINIDVSNRWPI